MWWIPITPYAEVCILRVSLRDREFFRNTEKSEILNVKNNGTTLLFFFFFFGDICTLKDHLNYSNLLKREKS